MAKTLLDLANSLERRVAKLDEEASKAAVKVALTIIGDLVYVTPVDTSQALSNWQASLNSPVDSKIPPHFPGQQGSTQKASASAALEAARSVLSGKKPGDKIYISNVLPYIRRLNDGYSAQAPAGFVERAVLVGRKHARKIKIRV